MVAIVPQKRLPSVIKLGICFLMFILSLIE
jgi:hypothetical protein